MKKIVIIGSLMLMLIAFLSHEGYGQLITDSQRRLKTDKPSSSGAAGIFNHKKGKSGSGRALRQSSRGVSPRSASGSPFAAFRKRQVTPRSVSGREPGSGKAVSPRYSAGSPFSGKKQQVSPRYSEGDVFKPSFLSKWFQKDTSPRYSPGSPFRSGHKSRITPRYSENQGRFQVDKRRKKENTIYNMGTVDYRGEDRRKTLWNHKLDKTLESRATKNFKGTKVPAYKPQANVSATEYSGNLKMKSLYKSKMHPSAKHLKANQNSEDLRNGLRKWNVFWTRINRNKPQPDAVTKKVSKPKFDRKEADIWNE